MIAKARKEMCRSYRSANSHDIDWLLTVLSSIYINMWSTVSKIKINQDHIISLKVVVIVKGSRNFNLDLPVVTLKPVGIP